MESRIRPLIAAVVACLLTSSVQAEPVDPDMESLVATERARVPEPLTLSLFGAGLLGVAFIRRWPPRTWKRRRAVRPAGVSKDGSGPASESEK